MDLTLSLPSPTTRKRHVAPGREITKAHLCSGPGRNTPSRRVGRLWDLLVFNWVSPSWSTEVLATCVRETSPVVLATAFFTSLSVHHCLTHLYSNIDSWLRPQRTLLLPPGNLPRRPFVLSEAVMFAHADNPQHDWADLPTRSSWGLYLPLKVSFVRFDLFYRSPQMSETDHNLSASIACLSMTILRNFR